MDEYIDGYIDLPVDEDGNLDFSAYKKQADALAEEQLREEEELEWIAERHVLQRVLLPRQNYRIKLAQVRELSSKKALLKQSIDELDGQRKYCKTLGYGLAAGAGLAALGAGGIFVGACVVAKAAGIGVGIVMGVLGAATAAISGLFGALSSGFLKQSKRSYKKMQQCAHKISCIDDEKNQLLQQAEFLRSLIPNPPLFVPTEPEE